MKKYWKRIRSNPRSSALGMAGIAISLHMIFNDPHVLLSPLIYVGLINSLGFFETRDAKPHPIEVDTHAVGFYTGDAPEPLEEARRRSKK